MKPEVTSGVLVHMRHIRAAHLCADGMKDWFTHHNLDYKDLRKGVPVEAIEATGDKMGLDVAAIARAEHGG